MIIDLSFQLSGTSVPADHGYALFAAISRELPHVHKPNEIGIHPIRGKIVTSRQMAITESSRLTIRVNADEITAILPLSGRFLNIAGGKLSVGIPQVFTLQPATALRSRIVVIKPATPMGNEKSSVIPPTEAVFMSSARKQLSEIGVSELANLSLGRRRTIRVHGKEIVGYEVLVDGLDAQESIELQEKGLGGKRHMGCGVFTPFLPRRDA